VVGAVTDTHPDHRLDTSDANVHHDWDADRDPVLTVEPGEVVRFECLDATGGELAPGATVEDVRNRDSPGHAMTGPVAVAGAEPGDGLAVELLAVETGDWGVTYVYPEGSDAGFLPGAAPGGAIHHWELDGDTATFEPGIEVPLSPFPGNLGLVPAEDGPHSTTPPRAVGGNLDVRHLVAGSRLELPVEVTGGLFSIGDGHAAQGDGEVCVTAIECPTTVDVRFELTGDPPAAPRFETPGGDAWREGPAVATTGVGPDLETAARGALSAMLDRLETRGLDRERAYMLCSVAADLQLSQVVNDPNRTVTCRLPTRVLGE
jgi:acetamidase/formamidase